MSKVEQKGTKFSISVDIAAPADKVWAVMRDVERWSEWTSTVTRIRIKGEGVLKVGAKLMIRQPKLPPALWKVVALEEGKGMNFISKSLVVSTVAAHWIESIPGGARVTLTIEFTGLLRKQVAKWTRTLNVEYLEIEVKGLKGRSER